MFLLLWDSILSDGVLDGMVVVCLFAVGGLVVELVGEEVGACLLLS